MPEDTPSSETKSQRLELMMAYVLGAVLLVATAFMWMQQRGWFTAEPVVKHNVLDRPAKPVELNTARWFELMQIRGIGEVRAKEIVRLRESKKNGFTSFDELAEIPGIDKKIIGRMKEKIRLKPGGRR